MIELHPLVEGFPCPVIVVAQDSQIMLFNDAALALFEGLEKGKPLAHATRNIDFLDAVQQTGNDMEKASIDFVLRKKQRAINATLIPLQEHSSGKKNRIIYIYMRDTSQQERLGRMRMHFIANASHELRTPLASLSGFIETLQTTAKNDATARKKFLGIMSGQAQRMSRLISDLLSLSKLEMNDEPLTHDIVDLVEISQDVVDGFIQLARKNSINLHATFPEKAVFVRGEKDDFVQVLNNLIQNAIRYGGDGREIIVSIDKIPPSKRHNWRVCLSVKDNGRGIDKKHIPHLTERFYRVDKVISRNKGGTGLGLAIAKHIIVRHRGKLVIKSRLGKGASFSVILPEAQKALK